MILAIIIIFSLYIAEDSFRKWVDVNIFRKNITTEDVTSIDLDTEKNNQIFCYDKYICILNNKNLQIYNTYGDNVTEIAVNINTAIFASEDKYLAIAEKSGQEFCVVSEKEYLWRDKVDGEILQIHINKNGYVVLVTTDTTYKSIITLYSPDGKQVFKNYLASTRIEDIAISNDNKYVAFSELDTTGTLIQSNIKIISVENAKTNAEEAVIYSYNSDISKMIVDIQYQEKDKLVCVYDDEISSISEENKEKIISIDNDITFVSANLNNNIAYIKEETTGIFNSESVLNIVNTQNNQTNIFKFDEVAKEMYAYGSVIGINIGTEMYFVGTNGMLIKEYSSNQEITNVMLSNELAIIIYKDRIDIIKL
jgi:hypothetical protein